MSAHLFDRRRLRRTAWATLVGWVLALAAGVANACALTPAGAAERAIVDRGVVAHGPADAPTAAAAATPDRHHGHEPDPGKQSCLKFCDDGSSAIAKVKLAVADLSATLLTVAEPWDAIVADGGAGSRQSLQRPGAQGPPLVIRFLRLTL